jgi:hypothetical protein
MNAPEPHPISNDAELQMRETLALQRDSYLAEGRSVRPPRESTDCSAPSRCWLRTPKESVRP